MCDDLCICISIGCPTRISQGGGDGQARICPRCHNASVYPASSRTWIEICFIPLVPCRSNEIWYCGICQWQADIGAFQPQVAGGWGGGPTPQMQMSGGYMQPGYGPPPGQQAYGPPPAQQGYPGGYGR